MFSNISYSLFKMNYNYLLDFGLHNKKMNQQINHTENNLKKIIFSCSLNIHKMRNMRNLPKRRLVIHIYVHILDAQISLLYCQIFLDFKVNCFFFFKCHYRAFSAS